MAWDRLNGEDYKSWLLEDMTVEEYNGLGPVDRRTLRTLFQQQQQQQQQRVSVSAVGQPSHEELVASRSLALQNARSCRLPGGVLPEGNIPAADNIPAAKPYNDSQLEFLSNLQQEAQDLFPIGTSYDSFAKLRAELRKFAHKKGFAISSVGTKLVCTRAETPQCYKNKRAKQATPIEKQRSRTSTRVGCCFKITCAPVNWRNRKEDKSITITKSSNYAHSNGCFPCRNQLVVEMRKASVGPKIL